MEKEEKGKGIHRMRDIVQRREVLDTRLAVSFVRIVRMMYRPIMGMACLRCKNMLAT